MGEPLRGAPDAGLHLVEDEQRSRLRGDVPGRGEVAGGGTTTPFSPWIGSRITIAVSGPTAASSAAGSPYGTKVTSPGSGRNGSTLDGCPVRASAPIVRPWKAPSAETTPVRPVSRDSLNAASLASAPELQKNAFPRRPASARSSSASATPGSETYRLETWPSVATCRLTASTTAGWPWPSALTAMPPSRSTYEFPASSSTTAPDPRTSATRGVP